MSSMITAPTAVAAQLYSDGSTMHTSYGINQGKLMELKGTERGANLNLRCVNNTLTVTDEISALTIELLQLMNKRLQVEGENVHFFGGVTAILLEGDFQPLPPGVDNGILGTLLRPKNEFERQLQQFHVTFLTSNERGRGDLWQMELVAKLTDTSSSYFPLNDLSLLRSTCTYCEDSNQPTTSCRHLHVSSESDLINDPSWLHAPIINASNDAADIIGNEKIKIYALSKGLPVLKWQLPSATQSGRNYEILSNLDNAVISQYHGLWGSYVEGMPVRINHNASLDARIVNGAQPCFFTKYSS